jgi:hypothetical protein
MQALGALRSDGRSSKRADRNGEQVRREARAEWRLDVQKQSLRIDELSHNLPGYLRIRL